MKRTATALVRMLTVAVATTAVSGCVVFFIGDKIPGRVHGWIIGALAVLLSISEAHFRGLITELTNIQRRGSYSVWQIEKLGEIMPAIRSNVWRLWALTVVLKALAGIAGAALLWDGLPANFKSGSIFFGYSCLVLSFVVSLWAQRNFRKFEDLCNEIVALESSKKERRRMRNELEGGEAHDFKNDPVMQGYSKPSRTKARPA